MMRYRYKILILSILLLITGFILLKNPFTEYSEIEHGSNEELSKKFIQLKYSYIWEEQSFGLIGDNLTNELTVITLKNDKLRVLNRPFSKSGIVLFKLLYNESEPSISVSFNLENNDATYYYQESPTSDVKYFSINDTEARAFIEKTSQLSVENFKEDIQTNQSFFLNGLHFVKDKKLDELKSDIKFRIVFFIVIAIICIALFILFSVIKV